MEVINNSKVYSIMVDLLQNHIDNDGVPHTILHMVESDLRQQLLEGKEVPESHTLGVVTGHTIYYRGVATGDNEMYSEFTLTDGIGDVKVLMPYTETYKYGDMLIMEIEPLVTETHEYEHMLSTHTGLILNVFDVNEEKTNITELYRQSEEEEFNAVTVKSVNELEVERMEDIISKMFEIGNNPFE